MVKPKKGKKNSESDTIDERTEKSVTPVEGMEESDSDPEVRPPKPEPKKKGKGKERAKKKSVSVESDSDGGEVIAPAASKGGFALLMGDDDSEEEAPTKARVTTDDESDPAPAIQKPKLEKGGKKSKKGKKKKDEDDEDLDKVLAELQLEYSGGAPAATAVDDVIDKKEAKKAKQKEKKKAAAAMEVEDPVPAASVEGEENEQVAARSANQKKKDKKKEKKREKKDDTPESQVDGDEKPTGEDAEDEEDDKKGKKKKKDKKEKEDKNKDAKGPGKKTIAAMQEALKKLREEEERLKREEEERIVREEEEERKREEALRLEKERKEKKKQKEKERKERMKAEGRLLTAKQKQDKARAQELINSLRAQGLELPEPGDKVSRPGTRIKPYKKLSQQKPPAAAEAEVQTGAGEMSSEAAPASVSAVEVVIVDPPSAVAEDVKDAWDADSSDNEPEHASQPDHVDSAVDPSTPSQGAALEKQASKEKSESSEGEEEDDDSDEGSEEESEDDSEDESDEEDEHKTVLEKRRDRAVARIQKRKEEAEQKRSLEYLRAAVVCVLGHVDTGKTKILDKLRRTNVQVGEAGGITQQIGATNVPIENINDNCRLVKGFADMELKLPGLLIIDTPGHESFSNLRSRGSSLCDIAILVVDIMHGLEPQTLESINLLKTRKTPFIVALNKIDRLYDWQTMGRKDVRDIIKAQAENTQREFEQRTKQVILEFAEQGLNASLFYESPDLRSYVSLVPTSAITGEGMGNLLALIVEFCQTMLAKRLMYSELLQATVLEVKQIPGLGTTIDCILINGKLSEGDTIVLAGTDGPVVTQIRSLLMPQPMKELRVKNAYIEYKEIKAAQGVKIAGKDLEKAIAGLNLQVAVHPDEVSIYCEEVARELKTALSTIKLKDRGVYVQASTLGSLEALLEFLRTSKIPVSGIRIGPVVKKDVMKASIMLEHESQYATILAFDVKIERDAQELADSLGVKIFQADIIYHLFDKFMAYREELKQKKRDEFKNIAVFPCKIRILPQFVFNSRDPIVVGVIIEAGVVKEGTPLCVPSKEFLFIGTVSSIEANHKNVDIARKGQEVCLKIENTTGDAPKMFGRHFDHTDIVTSRISRQSIDACKDYFRDDLTKGDWQLMVELKKLFQIM